MNDDDEMTLLVRHTYTIWRKTRTGDDLLAQEFTYKDACKEVENLARDLRTPKHHFKISYSVSVSAVTPELELNQNLNQNPDIEAITSWLWAQFQTSIPTEMLKKGLPPNP